MRRKTMKRNGIGQFATKFASNQLVRYDGIKWRTMRYENSYPDDSKHLYYGIYRGAWQEEIRGDYLRKARA